MIQETKVQEYFSKCTEVYDYVRKYKYFKKRFSINEKDEVLIALKMIEDINILGAIGILIHSEEDMINDFLPEFIEQNIDEIENHIKVDSDNIIYYMQIAYLCMAGLDEDECIAFAKKIFSGSVYKRVLPEKLEFENHDYVTRHYVKVFLSAITKFDNNIQWKKHYCKIVKAIFEARDKDTGWLTGVEIGLRKNPLGYEIENESAKDYFNFLCHYRLYQSAKYFLDNFDGSQSFLGLDSNQLTELVYSLPSAEMAAFGRWYSKEILNPDYTYEDWLRDVKKYNQNKDIIEWLELTVYYHELQESLEKDDYQLFESLMSQVDDYKIFDMEKVKYIKQLVECFAAIVNKGLIEEKIDIVKFLHDIEKININEYSRTRYLGLWNSLESINEEYDYNNIQNVLFEKYSLEDAVYIYMNSHLKNIINLEEFVKRCSEYCGEDVSVLFSQYPLWGQISNVSKMSSVRDKLFINPIGISTAVSYSEYVNICEVYGYNSKEAIAFNRKMIRNDQSWYSYNKATAELFVRGDYCTFYIKTYKKSAGLLVHNIELYSEIKEMRIRERNEIYPEKVLAWLNEIKTSKKYVDWNAEENIFGVRNIADIRKRDNIAVEILRTAHALSDNETELRKYLFAIINPPLEEINEFRYIPMQKKLDFEFEKDKFLAIRKEIIKITTDILDNNRLSSDIKKYIYLNTCSRKYYELQEVCRRISKQFYLETADEPFIFSVKLESMDEEKAVFLTRGRNNTLYSNKKFVYYGETHGLILNYIYLVELKEYDFTEKCFILNRVNLGKDETEQWKKYLRKMRDIKYVIDDKGFDEILKNIQRYKVKVSSEEHINQWVHEIDLIFKRQSYSVEKAIRTINTLKDTNPFRNMTFKGIKYAEEFRRLYTDTYYKFIEDYKLNYKSQMGMCDFFFTSYLRIFVKADAFIKDIAESEDEGNAIMNYCRIKKYIE